MRFPTKSALLDSKSAASRGIPWAWLVAAALVLGIYALIRNYVYVSKGMLKPNFGLVQRAYDFNFFELPLTLLSLTVLLSVGAFLWKKWRRNLLSLSILCIFFAIDLVALRYYVTRIEPQRLRVRHVRLETAKLTKPVRIVHLSDIQSGKITGYERQIFEQVKRLKPDLILNTGDFLQVVPPATFESEFPKLLELIKSTNPKYGTYAVFGDTEKELYEISPDQLLPLKMLSSRSEIINTSGGSIHLCGLSLYQSKNQAWAIRSVDDWLEQSQDNSFRILLGHAPDFALAMKEKPIDLCLAGHTHGGQVRVPWYGPLVIDSKAPREWARGFHHIGIPYLNVSAGAGSNRYEGLPPIRLNCPTEMTLIELVPLGFL